MEKTIVANYRVIAIDNEESELTQIVKGLSKLKIACIPILYEVGDDFTEKFYDVRIAFFDINLSSGFNEGSQLYSIITQAIKSIIAKDNGPYALIFWTKHKEEVENIKRFIDERERDDISSPLIVDCIDKVLINNETLLQNELIRILSNSTLSVLLDLETKVQNAASKTINSLFEIIPNTDKWGNSESFEENSKRFFSKIAIDAIGYSHAKKEPKKGIKIALLPILEHNLKLLNLDDSWDEKLSILSNSTKNDIAFPENFNKGILNSIFHLQQISSSTKDQRGVVLKCNINDNDINSVLGIEKKELIHTFLPFNKELLSKQEIAGIKDKSELLFIEISASCDYCQNNKRVYKYILGLKYPLTAVSKLRKRSESIFELPSFYMNEEDFVIAVNFRYVLGMNIANSKLGIPIYCLSDSIVNQIGNRYANYASRIGIVSF